MSASSPRRRTPGSNTMNPEPRLVRPRSLTHTRFGPGPGAETPNDEVTNDERTRHMSYRLYVNNPDLKDADPARDVIRKYYSTVVFTVHLDRATDVATLRGRRRPDFSVEPYYEW